MSYAEELDKAARAARAAYFPGASDSGIEWEMLRPDVQDKWRRVAAASMSAGVEWKPLAQRVELCLASRLDGRMCSKPAQHVGENHYFDIAPSPEDRCVPHTSMSTGKLVCQKHEQAWPCDGCEKE